MRTLISLTTAVALSALLLACPGDEYHDPPTGIDAGNDAQIQDAIAIVDVPALPERPISLEGPVITILTPQPTAVLSGAQTPVIATVTDTDGVDVSSVRAVIPGGAVFNLSRSGTVDDQYSGNIDLSEIPSGNMALYVEAADIHNNWNSSMVSVTRDTGPTVSFISPEDGERYAGSVNLTFQVSDPGGVNETSVRAEVGSTTLDIIRLQQDEAHPETPQWILFGGEIVFDDPMFTPPLQGAQQVTVTAENINNSVPAEGSVTFIVDDQGPVITVLQPQPGEIVGGIITIEAEVSDDAGVQDTSVVAVLGGNAYEYQLQLLPIGGSYSASFDTSQFPTNFVFPTLSVRAADMLSNESEVGFVLAVDNTRPIMSLDPPASFRVSKEMESEIMCSVDFDPVGNYVPDDLERVPQVFWIRARIEDQGNEAWGLQQTPLSLIDYSTPRVYFLADVTQALVVDTDGDGFCDEINPELVPSTNPQGANEVLALYLDPIEPIGEGDYRPDIDLPAVCDIPGDQSEIPDALCLVLMDEEYTLAIHYTVDPAEPAIWSLPPVTSGDAMFCAGHQFDALASNIPEGWVCAAVRAQDNASNIGVSTPLRICVDYEMDGNPSTCLNPLDAPDCTGTIDPVTQMVDPTVPCIFDPLRQQFRHNEVRFTW